MIRRKGKSIDKVTRDWIRNASDEKAAQNGCIFDGERGEFVVSWMERYLRLYEGEFAGEPFVCRDWQHEAFMRMFSWVRCDEEWSRVKGKPTWIRRFSQALIFIPKKNKKSPSLAALGLYLTCGDGEMGGKSFFFAKDGSQAREIAGKHSIEMLKQSPELMSECTINNSTFQITHEPTRSVLRPESSGDARSQESKEGLNGNILVDELHVVDRRLMNRVSRAGISRMEPFQIEVSTAGNNPDSYGKFRFEYGQDVIDGKIDDQRLFVYIAAAPQEISDAQIDADPVKWGRVANPAWGHTIREAEFLADWETSKRSGQAEIANFKMYRLNVWQQAANPLLDGAAWDDCKGDYMLQDLAGRGGGLGIDLSRTEDMSACVFALPDENLDHAWWLWPMVWMTREYAQKHDHLASFMNWAAAGSLKLVDRAAITDDDILPDLIKAIEIIRPTMCCYDQTYAAALAIKLEERTAMTCANFPQTFAAYANPTLELRSAVRDRRITHPGNQVLTWQAKHVMGTERAGMLKPIKDDKQRHKKIDAIQAAIMAIHACQNRPQKRASVYESEGPMDRSMGRVQFIEV